MIRIKVIDPQKPDWPQEVDLQPETMLNQECLIGRFSNCDLVLDSPEVSRMHGKVSEKNRNYYFVDLGSSCGSRINGENAQTKQDYLLKPDDVIQIGRFSLMILEIDSEEDNTIVESQKKRQSDTQGLQRQSGISHYKSEMVPTSLSASSESMPIAMLAPHQMQSWVKGDLTVRCIGIIDETHDVKTFRFVADPPVFFTYKAGQFVTLELEINGEQILRSYSIASTPSRPYTLEITVKRVPSLSTTESGVPRGTVSNWLHQNLRVGSTIKLNGPLGKFTCFDTNSQKLLLISAGSGIIPMMSMSRWLCDTGANCDLIFFHCARTKSDIIFLSELELMSARYPNFHLAVTTTRKQPGHSWLGLTGRLNAVMLQVIAPDFRDRTVYVCGPDGFMESVNQILQNLNFPMQNYHEESFGPPRRKSKSTIPKQQPTQSTANNFLSPPVQQGLKQMFMNFPTKTVPQSNVGNYTGGTPIPSKTVTLPKSTSPSQISVVFSQSGKEVVSDGEESILNLASSSGVRIRSSCLSGVCGSCKKRKLEGEVRMEGEPEGLEESELQEGYILTCISYPLGRVIIDA
ncbi:MAG: FHA domain-containing protein [Cyanomargarita calcarea GSE-NOS-MK-12-04C]|uniref:FHA domain-containing protein n=1 Tax=Cyanomargarita calcarea GSE-NOS-MK-12-04C TaxID=2839659 RepID=A0A951QRW0_9CYAN|nr:FHA domain-containing protein [Cyanomargarita calcarea GSE-NOS-MK-12-04C]